MKEKEMVLKYIGKLYELVGDDYSKSCLKLVKNFILANTEKKEKIIKELEGEWK